MKLEDIYVRDPFILLYEGTYYLYSKLSVDAREFVVYKSGNLTDWSEPETVFKPTEDFWGKYDFWAPREWESLDGTLYVDNNNEPHIVFCHEWEQIGDGTVCEMKLSEDLTRAVTKPKVLWSASDFSGSVNAAHDNRLSLVTDGPFLFRSERGELLATWSTMGRDGYLVCLSRSSNGDIDGKWSVMQTPVYKKNGGHGLVFNKLNGKRCFVMHKPNIHPLERASIYEFNEQKNKLTLTEA